MSGSPQMSVHPKHIKLQSHNITDHILWQNKVRIIFQEKPENCRGMVQKHTSIRPLGRFLGWPGLPHVHN